MKQRTDTKSNFSKRGWWVIIYCLIALFLYTGTTVDGMNITIQAFVDEYGWDYATLLGFGTVAGLTRYTRAELTEVLTSDYLLLARTKGLSRAQTVVRHALRNAMVPIFPMILGEFVGIMSGSIIIEQIFGIPGVGPLYVSSITAATPDYNFFMLLSAFYTLIGLLSGIIVDISYGLIDPRIRMGSKK